MTNWQIYKKTLPFTGLRILFSLLGLALALAIPVVAFLLSQGNESACVTVTVIAAVVGLVVFVVLCRYLSYLFKAGQIAMMTAGLTDGQIPDRVVAAGKEAVKSRFVAANVYFALDSAIKAITSQLTKGITGAAGALGSLGGEQGSSVAGGIGGAISAFVSIILEYVNSCCLAWVFYHKEQNAFRSTCDGAVIYFQNWKVLLKNAGKVFGVTLLSLLLIGGAACGLSYALIGQARGLTSLLTAIGQSLEVDGDTVRIIASGAVGLICWGVLHSALVAPYLLVSVLRKYLEAGAQNPPKVDVYEKLCGISKKFKQTWRKAEPEATLAAENGGAAI